MIFQIITLIMVWLLTFANDLLSRRPLVIFSLLISQSNSFKSLAKSDLKSLLTFYPFWLAENSLNFNQSQSYDSNSTSLNPSFSSQYPRSDWKPPVRIAPLHMVSSTTCLWVLMRPCLLVEWMKHAFRVIWMHRRVDSMPSCSRSYAKSKLAGEIIRDVCCSSQPIRDSITPAMER